MPLAPAVVAFADQYRGRIVPADHGPGRQFNWGTMLPEALERSRTVVSRDAVLLAWVGQAAGMLPKALRMAAASRSSPVADLDGDRRAALLHPRAPAGHADRSPALSCILSCPSLRRSSRIFTAAAQAHHRRSSMPPISLVRYGFPVLAAPLDRARSSARASPLVLCPGATTTFRSSIGFWAGGIRHSSCVLSRPDGRGGEADLARSRDPGEPLSDLLGPAAACRLSSRTCGKGPTGSSRSGGTA